MKYKCKECGGEEFISQPNKYDVFENPKTMELKDGVRTFHAKTRREWRTWLEKNHQSEKSVWLIIYKKESIKKKVKRPAFITPKP